MKLKTLIDEWLQFKKISIKESTNFRYVYIINQYILPYFKEFDLEQLVRFICRKIIKKFKSNISKKYSWDFKVNFKFCTKKIWI